MASGLAGVGPARHRRVFVPVLIALAALAWLTLWAWACSPYGGYLDHGDWAASAPDALLGRALPGGDLFVPILLYAAAWAPMITAVILTKTVAGAFRFSRLKYRCRERYRCPLRFAIEHWRSRDPARQAFLPGLRHGAFCVGCCWALLRLMFVVGAGSPGWMLRLAAAMSVERNLPWRRRLSTPLGIARLGGAALLVVPNL